MKTEFIEYVACSTCKRAKKYLEDKKIEFIDRDIKNNTPTYEELESYVVKFEIPIKKLFNTSGLKYKSLNLKEKLLDMSDNEKLKLLASDGMLIKRPLLITHDNILIGFKEKEWNNYFVCGGVRDRD